MYLRSGVKKDPMFLCVFMSRPINLAKLPQHRAMNYPLVTTKRYQLKRVTKAGEK